MSTAPLVDFPATQPSDIPALDQFIELTKVKRDLEKQLKDINGQLAKAEAEVICEWQENGTEQTRKNGMTVFIKRELSIKAKDGDTLAVVGQLIPDPNLRFLLGVNHMRLRSQLKEWCFNDEIGEIEPDINKLPEALRGVVEITEYSRLNARAS